ncbi:MAG: hypothetical protein PUD93_05575 [Lachnospiraceae bacterium]|nr:hypothetical protein [Lachnospiraceae bacterium]
MDKYEYKVRADEIKALIAEGEFAEAVKIADTIDWRRVKSVMMLCTISDLYKINRRYQESKDILLLAYEKHPTGRLIVYSLCELSIKMEEYVQAIEYYKEFVQIAPKDTGRYILQYRLYEAQDVSLEERIAVLEEFKKRDYREKWAYELAYLYHRIGLTTKCVEECDEMYLWFGEGKYVLKALELKALHVPLNADQQAKYDTWIAQRDAEIEEEKEEELTAADEEAEEDINDAEIEEQEGDTQTVSDIRRADGAKEINSYREDAPTTELPEVKTVDVGQYNTINLQMALAESMKEILAEEEPVDVQEEEMPIEQEEAESVAAVPEAETVAEQVIEAKEESEEPETSEEEEETQEPSIAEKLIAPLLQETVEMPRVEIPKVAIPQDTDELQEIGAVKKPAEEPKPKPELSAGIPGARTGVLTPLNAKPTKYDDVLSQEYDGQISLAIPDAATIEKQITGQLSIEDIMAEWEEMKKDNEQKRMEDVRKRILEHTGSLFADFDEATKTGLLEQLEKAFVEAIMKESDKPAIKKVILPDEAEKELDEAAKAASKSVTQSKKISSLTKTEEPSKAETVLPEPMPEEDVTVEDEVEELEEIEEANIPEEMIDETVPKETAKEEVPAQEEKTVQVQAIEETSEQKQPVRELTEEEKELFGQFIHHKKSREQLIHTLDNMSLAACTGNVIITGEEDGGTISLAKGLIREMQYNDSNFSGKVAKVSGAVLNKKDVAETFAKLSNGALIIEKASDLKPETAAKIVKVLEKDNMGLILILEDRKQKMNQLIDKNPALTNNINLRVDIEPLNDEALVAYAKQYAEDMEYSIDEFGVLALHTRIADMQTSDHEVTLAEVRELVDEAIYYADKKTPKHFFDILLAKRYDEEDMIILREKDFMHY